MRVYFLDRNVISIIKDSNLGKKQIYKNKLIILRKLREIDNKGVFITPIISIFEDQLGKFETIRQIEEVIECETKVLEKFFHHAELDKFLDLEKIKHDLVLGKKSKQYINNIRNKENFLISIKDLLVNKPRKADLREILNRILLEAQKSEFNKTSPIVFACLLCACGNDMCRKILKPTKNQYYNVAMDFTHFSLFSFFKSQLPYTYKRGYKEIIHSKFLTNDRGLNEFFTYFDFNTAKSIPLIDGFFIQNLNLSNRGKAIMPDEVRELFE